MKDFDDFVALLNEPQIIEKVMNVEPQVEDRHYDLSNHDDRLDFCRFCFNVSLQMTVNAMRMYHSWLSEQLD